MAEKLSIFHTVFTVFMIEEKIGIFLFLFFSSLDLKMKLLVMPCVEILLDLENVTFHKYQDPVEDNFLISILIKRKNNVKNSPIQDVSETQTDLKLLENANNLACQLQMIKICVINVLNLVLAGRKNGTVPHNQIVPF